MSDQTQTAPEPSDEYNRAAFDLIVSLRGGLPGQCDFCGQPFSQKRHPVPEEAGEWACTECVARWEDQER
jgi:hypothetical protein